MEGGCCWQISVLRMTGHWAPRMPGQSMVASCDPGGDGSFIHWTKKLNAVLL